MMDFKPLMQFFSYFAELFCALAMMVSETSFKMGLIQHCIFLKQPILLLNFF